MRGSRPITSPSSWSLVLYVKELEQVGEFLALTSHGAEVEDNSGRVGWSGVGSGDDGSSWSYGGPGWSHHPRLRLPGAITCNK